MRQRRGALHRALRRQQIPIEVGGPALRHAHLHHLQAAADAGQQIVEVVREAAGQLADGFHLLRLAKLLLDRALLGQVARDLGEADQLARVVADRIDDHASPEPRAVLAHPPAFGFEAALARGGLQRDARDPRRAILVGVEPRKVLAHDLVGGIALEALGAGVPAADTALGSSM